MVANHPSGFFALAAVPRQPLAVTAWPTSPCQTRVRGFRRHPSGQTSARRRRRSIITPSSRTCAYKTASGRHEWLNRDPLGEIGFEIIRKLGFNSSFAKMISDEIGEENGGINPYEFIGNMMLTVIDLDGLKWWWPPSWPIFHHPHQPIQIKPTGGSFPGPHYGQSCFWVGISIGQQNPVPPPQEPGSGPPPTFFWPPLPSGPPPGGR